MPRFTETRLKQQGQQRDGVRAYAWVLEKFAAFVRGYEGRPALVSDFTPQTIQAWLDAIQSEVRINTLRHRQCVVFRLCAWLVRRGQLSANPVARLDRPRRQSQPPRPVPGPAIMDQLVQAAKARRRPRDLAIFLLLRYTGMRRAEVADLRVHHLYPDWGLRGVRAKGRKTRDIPVPRIVMEYLHRYVEEILPQHVERITTDTPLFWSSWGLPGSGRKAGKITRPMEGKNIWHLCKTYGKRLGYPELRPHDLRHGVAMEMYEQHGDLEQVRGLLGHSRIDTTQVYAQIRPEQLDGRSASTRSAR
jgi:integrase/recombinase XerC